MRQFDKIEAAKYMDCSIRTLERMAKNGDITQVKKGNKVYFNKKELKLVMTDLAKRQVKHRPNDFISTETTPPPDRPGKPVETRDLIFEMGDKPEELLNEIGKGELLRVTKLLEAADLLEVTDPMLIMKYALCQQMFFKYMSVSDSEEELKVVSLGTTTSPYFKMMESYQRQVQFYEKELGLTTASRLKMKAPAPKPVKSAMQALLDND